MTDDPFDSFSKATDKCAECGGTGNAHFVFCTKLDAPIRRH